MNDIEDFIDGLPRDERLIVKRLRALILQAEPRLSEKLAYGVPYFSRNRRLFFLWPASAIPCVKKGSHPPKVTLGFCYGNLLSNEQKLLISEGRKQVYTINISSLSEINERLLLEVLNEAVLVDEQFFNRRKEHNMNTPLRSMYNPAFFERLCPVLDACIPNFDRRDFIFRIFNNAWPDMELRDRVKHIAAVLHHFLPDDFPEAVRHVINISRALQNVEFPQRGLEHIFLRRYVEAFGQNHPELARAAKLEVAKTMGGDFSVAPLLMQDQNTA